MDLSPLNLDEFVSGDMLNITIAERYRRLLRLKEIEGDFFRKLRELDENRYRPGSIAIAPPTPPPTLEPTEPPELDFTDDLRDDWMPWGVLARCMGYLYFKHHMPWWAVVAIAPTRWTLPFLKSSIHALFKFMILPWIEALVFVSGIVALVVMADIPVQSLKQCGLLWFKDLTVPDRCYALPLMISAVVALEIVLGTRNSDTKTVGTMRYISRAKPLIILPITIQLAAAVQYYWLVWSLMTLLQMRFLRHPKVIHYPNAPTCPEAALSSAPEDASESNILTTIVHERNEQLELQ